MRQPRAAPAPEQRLELGRLRRVQRRVVDDRALRVLADQELGQQRVLQPQRRRDLRAVRGLP